MRIYSLSLCRRRTEYKKMQVRLFVSVFVSQKGNRETKKAISDVWLIYFLILNFVSFGGGGGILYCKRNEANMYSELICSV
jgi:hypothetical protein